MVADSAAARRNPLNIEISNIPSSYGNHTYEAIVEGKAKNLTVSDCINEFAVQFQTKNSAVVLVGNNNTELEQATDYGSLLPAISEDADCAPNPFSWICGMISECSFEGSIEATYCPTLVKTINQSDWEPFHNRVSYCLTIPEQEQCTLQFATSIGCIVVIVNALKAVVLFCVWYFIKEDPLITIGDAVCSFLQTPDETTRDRALMTAKGVKEWSRRPKPQLYLWPRGRRYGETVSRMQWLACVCLYGIALTVCMYLLIHGSKTTQLPSATLFSLGFGAVNQATILGNLQTATTGMKGVIANAFLANLPQVILSGIYFTYNGIFTSFMLGIEWDNYAKASKGLRVSSHPVGAQRTTYFLQLPYRWCIPLMVFSGIFHWLTSQSIFIVSILVLSGSDGYEGGELITCGWSPSAVVSVICVGALMVGALVFAGTMKLEGRIPIASSCSAAISAACHVRYDAGRWAPKSGPVLTQARVGRSSAARKAQQIGNGEDIALLTLKPHVKVSEVDGAQEAEIGADITMLPLQWGDTGKVTGNNADNTIRHCAFSSWEVSAPQEGDLYI